MYVVRYVTFGQEHVRSFAYSAAAEALARSLQASGFAATWQWEPCRKW